MIEFDMCEKTSFIKIHLSNNARASKMYQRFAYQNLYILFQFQNLIEYKILRKMNYEIGFPLIYIMMSLKPNPYNSKHRNANLQNLLSMHFY